jgi:hypothetical protein
MLGTATGQHSLVENISEPVSVTLVIAIECRRH